MPPRGRSGRRGSPSPPPPYTSRHNNNGSAMNIDTTNGVPVTCFTCHQTGHKSNNCPQRINSNNGQGNNANNSQQRNDQQNQQQGQQNRQQKQQQNLQQKQRVQCTYCQKLGHSEDSCRTKLSNNPPVKSSSNSSTTKSNSWSNTSNTTTTVALKGYAFANWVPTTTSSSEPYCATCNVRTHRHEHCPASVRSWRLQHSKLVCWRCGFRGHTGDQCQHPEPSTLTKRCGVCHLTGHETEKCSNEVQRKLDTAVRAMRAQHSGGRAVPAWEHCDYVWWTPDDVTMGGTGQQQSSSSSPHSHPQIQPDRLQLYRAHANRSASLYPKRNYNNVLRSEAGEIVRTGLMNWNMSTLLNAKMAMGAQFFRDPQAMGAMIDGQTATCWCCGGEGVFLDHEFRGVVGRDALELIDEQLWGVFVMMECRCSQHGYGYR